MLPQAIQVSGADNSNNSSNLDTSLKSSLMSSFYKINHKPFKMVAIFKMAAKKKILHLSLGCLANKTPCKLLC